LPLMESMPLHDQSIGPHTLLEKAEIASMIPKLST
jgi:hypothetical protein